MGFGCHGSRKPHPVGFSRDRTSYSSPRLEFRNCTSLPDAHPDIFTGLRSQGRHCSYISALLWEACCCKSAMQQVSAWAMVPKASQMTQMEATKLHSSYTCAVVCAAPRCTCSAAEGCCVGRQVPPSKLSLSQGSDFLDLGCMGQAPTPLQYLGSFSSR